MQSSRGKTEGILLARELVWTGQQSHVSGLHHTAPSGQTLTPGTILSYPLPLPLKWPGFKILSGPFAVSRCWAGLGAGPELSKGDCGSLSLSLS